MKSVPEIRFPGFIDLWELRKVGEFAVESCDKGHNGQEALKLTVKLHTKGVCKMEEKGQGSDNTQYYVRHAGQLIYGKQNFFNGAIGIVPQSLDGYESTKDVPAFDIDDNVCVEWFYQYIARPGIYKSQEVNCTGTGSKRFHVNAFFDMNIPIPLIEEQKKISDYFKAIDNLITLQEQRCQVLKRLKQCMLQKMFPKDGSDTPEIRFPGFTDSWEQRKLGEVFEQTAHFVNPNEEEIELWSLTVEGGLTSKTERYNREFLVKKDNNFKEVRPGEIVYNPMNMTLGAVGYNGMTKSVAVSGYYTTMIAKNGHDSYYVNTWLKSPQAISLYKTFATGSLIEKQRVQYSTLSVIPAAFPKHEEQVKIGKLFSSLDNLITLSEKKCKVLKKLKQCMLQKMFV